jgi:predicted membrane channel-forming protein YqfA (hemolysin III family)
MDYQHYRGETLIAIPHRIRRRLHLLRYVGLACFAVSIAIPMLILMRVIQSTFLASFLTWTLITLGPALFLVGMIFNNIIDRSR